MTLNDADAVAVCEDLERLICALADIGESNDVDARAKARRLYREMRTKYPLDVSELMALPTC